MPQKQTITVQVYNDAHNIGSVITVIMPQSLRGVYFNMYIILLFNSFLVLRNFFFHIRTTVCAITIVLLNRFIHIAPFI